MTGGIVQLKLRGTQDTYLTGSRPPPVLLTQFPFSFFEKEYKPHVNFSIEQTKVYFVEDVNFNKKITSVLPKRADLLSSISLVLKLPALSPASGTYAGWTNAIGHAIIDTVDIEIGNRLIDRHFGLFLEIWDELTGRDKNENPGTGKTSNSALLETNAEQESTYTIPLKFWFCRELHRAIPLINLFYEQVKIIIKLRPFSECIVYDGATAPTQSNIQDAYLLVDYVYLDDNERMLYKQKTNSLILIDQLQIKEVQGDDTNTLTFKTSVTFNMCIKEILWVFIEEDSISNNDWFNFSKRVSSGKVYSLMKNASLLADGKELEPSKDEFIYRVSNTSRYHTNTTDKHIYCISFSDKPEEYQPSGSMNFSKIDDVILFGNMRSITPNKMYIFGINYNFLSIKDGQSTVLFVC